MKIAVLSNVNLDLLVKLLGKTHTVFQADGYGQWISYALENDPALSLFAPKVIFLILGGNALTENIVPFDLRDIISEAGRNAAYSNKMWYMGSIPYRTSFFLFSRQRRSGH